MCLERLGEEFERTEARVTETVREEELAQPGVVPEPTEELEEVRDADKEYAHV